MSGFSNSEEEAVGKTQVVPFLLEDKLKQLGGLYKSGPDWVCVSVLPINPMISFLTLKIQQMRLK